MKCSIIALLLSSLNCFGATFYVATNGNDAAAGTIGAPWLTIRHGVITMSTWDTLNIRGGTYGSDGFQLEEFKNNVTIQSYTNEWAIFKPAAFAHGMALFSVTNVVLNGFEIDGTNCTSDGIKFAGGAFGITVTNVTIRGVPVGMGLQIMGVNEGEPMNSLITHCRFITNGWGGPLDHFTNNPGLHQAYVQASGITIENCFFDGATNTQGQTIGINYFGGDCTNGVFRNNFLTNCGTGILAGASRGSNCWIYNNVLSGNLSAAIDVYQMASVYVLNNTISSNASGINVRTATNVVVENNITVNSLARGIYLQLNANGVTVRNNISYTNTWLIPGNSYGDLQVDTAFNVTTNDNLFHVVNVGGTKTTNGVYDAKFVSPAGGNFQVLAGSDAIGRGKPQTVFNTDAAGNLRINWTIGAYEFLMPTTFINNALIYNVHGL